jgi:hypothetical protein
MVQVRAMWLSLCLNLLSRSERVPALFPTAELSLDPQCQLLFKAEENLAFLFHLQCGDYC